MPGSKTIFVANIPFDTSEEQLAGIFSEAGPVQGVDIKFGPDGKPRGFGFIQFYDEAAAASAVRNLNGSMVNDRALRIEASSDTPNHRQSGRGGGGGGGGSGGGGGGGGGRGGPPRGGRERSSPPPPFRPPPAGAGYGAPPMSSGPGGYGPPPPMGMGGGGAPPPPGRLDIGMLPPGIELPRGEKALDQITKTLAEISPGQLQDVMAGMKTLVSTQPDQAHALLSQKPQLAYALFQAMIQLNIVDPQVVQQIQATPAPGYQAQAPPSNYPPPPAQAQAPYPPQQQYGQAPPPSFPPSQGGGGGGDPRLNSYRPPPPNPTPGYGAPPPQSQYAPPVPAVAPGLPPAVMAQLDVLPPDQRDILKQVLLMSPDQINALDAEQRANIMQLRQQFLGV